MRRIAAFVAAGLCAGTACARAPAPPAPVIEIADIDRFYELYDRMDGRPTAAQLQNDYLDKGSQGLRDFAQRRRITGEAIAETLAARPALYVEARRCADVMPRVRERAGAALAELVRLYPPAHRPAVTVAVGRGKPVGIGYPDTGVQLGLEALCAIDYFTADIEDRFVYVIAHEYIHVQQAGALADGETPTVLRLALLEGAADFIGELIAGGVAHAHFDALTAGRETEIETRFLADLDNTDLSDWFYNGTLEQPGDLGYWVGYRIVKAYYLRSSDKARAVREILEMTDPKAFLAKSGWRPGAELP